MEIDLDSPGFIGEAGGRVLYIKLSNELVNILDRLCELSQDGRLGVELNTKADAVRWLLGVGYEAIEDKLPGELKEWGRVSKLISAQMAHARRRIQVMSYLREAIELAIQMAKEDDSELISYASGMYKLFKELGGAWSSKFQQELQRALPQLDWSFLSGDQDKGRQ